MLLKILLQPCILYGFHPGNQTFLIYFKLAQIFRKWLISKPGLRTSGEKWDQEYACFVFFPLVFIRLCTLNSSSRVRMPVSNLTVMSRGAWGRAFRRNDLNCSACQKDISCLLRANWKHRKLIFAHTNRIFAHHLDHSSDLALCNFVHFLKMKNKSMGRHLDTLEEIQRVSRMELDALTERDCEKCPFFAIYLHLPSPFHMLIHCLLKQLTRSFLLSECCHWFSWISFHIL